MKVYWLKRPWSTKFHVCSEASVYSNGKRDNEEVFMSVASFTKYGIVHVGVIPHSDKALLKYSKTNPDLAYYTHYAMVHNGKIWRAYSWGGQLNSKAIAWRTNKFARDVMREMENDGEFIGVSASKEMRLENERLRDALKRLVDLVMSMIETAMPRIGIVWSSPSDYPTALRNAIKILGR